MTARYRQFLRNAYTRYNVRLTEESGDELGGNERRRSSAFEKLSKAINTVRRCSCGSGGGGSPMGSRSRVGSVTASSGRGASSSGGTPAASSTHPGGVVESPSIRYSRCRGRGDQKKGATTAEARRIKHVLLGMSPQLTRLTTEMRTKRRPDPTDRERANEAKGCDAAGHVGGAAPAAAATAAAAALTGPTTALTLLVFGRVVGERTRRLSARGFMRRGRAATALLLCIRTRPLRVARSGCTPQLE